MLSASDPFTPAAGRLPDFAVIGAMKCGTSTLHNQLAANSEFFMSDPKEPNFFSDNDVYARGLDWYRALFTDAAPDQLCGESSTHYTKLPTYPLAAERLIEAMPEARLLYVIRDPIERIVSQYIHEWSQREVRLEIDRAVIELPRYLAYSRYAMQLRPYLEAVGAERTLLVFFERLVAEPQRELDRIARFLGVETALHWDGDRGAKNSSRERMRKSPLRDAIVDAPIVTFLRRRFVPQTIRDRIKGYWQMEERPALLEATRARLEAELDLDLAELGDWLGLELDCQRYGEAASKTSGDWSERGHARFPLRPSRAG